MDIEKEEKKIIKEIQEFAQYQPKGEDGAIAYLLKAREIVSSYERMIDTDFEGKIFDEINLIRHYLKNYPDYLEFHRE